MVDIFSNPYKTPAPTSGGTSTAKPSLTNPLIKTPAITTGGQSIPGQTLYNPLIKQPSVSPLVSVPTAGPTPVIDNSAAPVVSVDTSGVKPAVDSNNALVQQINDQISSLTKQIESMQGGKGQDTAQTGQDNTQGGGTSSPFDKLLSDFQAGQKAISDVPAVPSLDSEITKVLATFGFTPESFKQVSSLTTELNSTNDQLNKLEVQRGQDLSRIELTPGGTIAAYGAEEARINREYAFREAGLGAKASSLSAQIATLTGAYDKAQQYAKDYVTAATQQRQQAISDIQYSLDFYKDVYKAMDASDQKRMNDLLDFQAAQLKSETTSANSVIKLATSPNTAAAFVGVDLSKITPEEAQQIASNYLAKQTSSIPGQIVNASTGAPVKLSDTQSQFFSMANHLISTANDVQSIINDLGTNAIKGWYTENGVLVPIVQNLQDPKVIDLMQKMYDMNNLFVYFSTGKQLNESEFKRLSKQQVNIQATKEYNQLAAINFANSISERVNNYLTVNGWGFSKGSTIGSGAPSSGQSVGGFAESW